MEQLDETRYGRLLVNAEIYPCAELSCVKLDAIRISRIGKCRPDDKNKKPTEVLDRETEQGKVDLHHGRIEQILDQAAENAGLPKAQYRC